MMHYHIQYMDSAIEGIQTIRAYLGRHSSTAPSVVTQKIIGQIKKLATAPNISRVAALDPRFRQMPVGNYVVFYLVDEENKTVEIHYIWDGRRNLERLLKAKQGEKAPAFDLAFASDDEQDYWLW